MKSKLFRSEVIAVVIAAFILAFMLMVKPIVGIADNGDFSRIMGSTGLDYLTATDSEKYIGFINRLFYIKDITLNFSGNYVSSEIIIVKFAILINRLIKDNGIFDIRYLALVYSAVFLFSIYFILKHNKQKSKLINWLLPFLIIGVFTDIGYISYFNSLYGEPVSFTSLILMVGIILYLVRLENPSLWVLVAFFTTSLFLIAAKVQNLPICIIIILFCFRLWNLKKDKLWRSTILISSVLIIIISASIYLSTPKVIKNCNKYQTVFYGILKNSTSPEKDLDELGLDQKFSVLAGTNFFMKNLPYNLKDPSMEKELYDKIKRSKIMGFYLKHPLRYINKLEKTANNAFSIRQAGFGNYEKAENIKFGQMSNSFGIWSGIKKSIFPHSLTFVIIFFIFYFGILSLQYIKTKESREKAYIEVFMLIGLIGLIQFLIPVLGDGEADLSKHLFLFNVSFDMMFVSGITWISTYFSSCFKKFSL